MGVLENMIKLVFKKGIVVHKSQLSKTVYHIRIQNDSFKNMGYTPGDFLRFFVDKGNKELSLREKLRSYSVWSLDKEKCELDMAVTTLGKGPGTQWVLDCKEGDIVYFVWHKGRFNIDSSADAYVFIGDLSALSTLYEFNRNLSSKKVYSIVYSQDSDDFFADIDGNTPFEYYSLPHNPAAEILEKLSFIKQKLERNTNIYVAGDSRICVAVSQFLRKEWKWDARQIKAKPYWNPLKPGLE